MDNYEKYGVFHNGILKHFVNRALLEKQNAEDNLEAIKALHVDRYAVLEAMENTGDSDMLKVLGDRVFTLEAELQALWKFPQDPNYIKFWEVPKCICPTMDNEEAYPYGRYVKRMDCPVHGTV